MSRGKPVLTATGLRVSLTNGLPVVDDVSFTLREGEILGLVGESGSGKTTLSVALLGYARRGARIEAGEVTITGERVVGQRRKDLEGLRGRLIAYVPQDPATALNPARRIRDQVLDRLPAHPRSARASLLRAALAKAQLPSAPEFSLRYPHQLSGGQQQRALIAMALAGQPRVLVLDEPTTGLDVVVQEKVLAEVVRLRDELGLTLVYVSHDVAAVSAVADEIAVMYAGRIVEQGPTRDVLARPKHPYTAGLVESVPDHTIRRPLRGIPGAAVAVGRAAGLRVRAAL